MKWPEDFIGKVIHGDCLEVMRQMPTQCIDAVVTSPPYNMNLRIRNGKYCSRQIVKEISTKYENFSDNLPMEDYFKFNKMVIDECLRVSKMVFYNVQFLTGNKTALFKLMGYRSSYLKEMIVWNKIVAEPAIGEAILNSQFEVILVFDAENSISRKFHNSAFLRGTLSNHWDIPRGKKQAKNHGAVFPISLAEKIISNFSKEGQIILDPFMGTGTTGVACESLNRKFVGIDISNNYCEFARKRIKVERADKKLF